MGRAELEALIDRAVRPDVPLRVLFAALDRYTELLRPVLDDESARAAMPDSAVPDSAVPDSAVPDPTAPDPTAPEPAVLVLPVAPGQPGPTGPPGPPE